MIHQRTIAAFTTTSTAATAAAMTSSSSEFSGWIVPRILPQPTQSQDQNEFITSSQAQSSPRQIDPTLLRKECGLAYHPFAPSSRQDADSNEGPMLDDTMAMDAHSRPLGNIIGPQSESTTLDVYVFPNNNTANSDKTTLGETMIHVHLDRGSNETVSKTLQRVVLNLKKKLFPKDKKHKSKSEPGKPNQKGPSSSTAAVQEHAKIATLWKMDPQNENSNQHLQEWNVENCSNYQVWKEAITTPLVANLRIEDITLSLPVDSCPPTIVTVETFEDFTARVFCHVPLVVEVQSHFATHVCIDWYVGDQLACHDSPSYTPQEADIGQHVSVLITPTRHTTTTETRHSGRGYEEAYRFEKPVEALQENTIVKLRQGDLWTNPNRRQSSQSSSSTSSTCSSLRVLTYNILADQNAYTRDSPKNDKKSEYPYVHVSILDKARRMPLLLHEILVYQADIICLQEVDQSVWDRLFRPVLESQGYQGYFSVKTTGANEGCAMLWSLHRFFKVPQEQMKHYALTDLLYDTIQNADEKWTSAADIQKVLEQNPELKDIIDTKLGHVVQMISLPLKDQAGGSPERILVANTHLFYHPRAAHVRLLQIYAICRQFEVLRGKHPYPMMLCGDMNSSLRRAAGYLLMNRKVPHDLPTIPEDFNTFRWGARRGADSAKDSNDASQEEEELELPNDMRIEHLEESENPEEHWEDFPSIGLPEHFPTFLTGYPIEPKFTHYLPVFSGSLDHIFISQTSDLNPFGLVPRHSAPMPTVADVTEHVGMPSEKLPSDHVSLVADLDFIKAR